MKKGKTKSRIMCGILYPDDNETHKIALSIILKKYNSLAICHDKDKYLFDVTDENGETVHKKGELKKAHYHIIIKFDNPRYTSGVAKELKLEENLIQCCSNFKSYVIYCTHRDEPLKHQYDVTDFIGALVPQVIKLLDKPQDKGDMLVDVLEYIKAHPSISWYQLVLWCNTFGYYETLLRNKSIISDVLYEFRYDNKYHNYLERSKKQ